MLDPQESAAKLALDHAELIERRPTLQREAARFEMIEAGYGFRDYRLNARGGYILILPDDPAVAAYLKECAATYRGCEHDWGGRPSIDPVAAKLNYVDACELLDAYALTRLIGYKPVTLSAVIEAKVAARYWFGIMRELRYFRWINRQNRWAKGFRPLRKLVRVTDSYIETRRRSRGADPLPIVRRARYE